MDRNEEIKKISELLYNEYISNGWKNVSTEGCERQAINYIDVRDLVKKLTLTDVVVLKGTLCGVCNNDQVFETEDGYTVDCPRCN